MKEYTLSGNEVKPPGIGIRDSRINYLNILDMTQGFMGAAGQLEEVGTFNARERHDWLYEECLEYFRAHEREDEAGEVDGLLDIIVIAWGTLLQRYGPEWARRLAWEVARSNMDKVEGPGLPILRGDGKVQKPEGWKPPDIANLLEEFHRLNETGE